ncbi:M23 family metallopeptidase [Streptomyces wedmorensis]|uniref:M23 family metallopeptidase n=1 Tax=Streptomyces wedmorensis TaxID=43759 RepID=UPI003F4D28DE
MRRAVVATVGAIALAGAATGTAAAEPAPAHAGWDGSRRAVGPGRVVAAGYGRSYGYEVVIRHPDGRYTQYAHLSRIDVTRGQGVSAGQRIARSGATGRVTGPHLHFEVRTAPSFGADVNPPAYLRGHGVRM